jgi:hypothetical protein
MFGKWGVDRIEEGFDGGEWGLIICWMGTEWALFFD